MTSLFYDTKIIHHGLRGKYNKGSKLLTTRSYHTYVSDIEYLSLAIKSYVGNIRILF